MGHHTAGWGGWRGRYLLSSHPFTPVFLFPLQNNILVVKDDSNHPMSVVSSTKSRWVRQGYSHSRAGSPQPASPFAGASDPPQWALTPFSLPTPPDWPCSTGMDTLWITSASLSLTTSSRASSTSTPLAKCPRPCSEIALVSLLPTALHHSSLSLSPCLHLSPHPMASCPCLPLTPSTNALLCSHREWFGLFFWGAALPCEHGEGGGAGQGATCSMCSQHVPGKWCPQSIFPACSEQGLPILHHLTQLKLNKSGWIFFY